MSTPPRPHPDAPPEAPTSAPGTATATAAVTDHAPGTDPGTGSALPGPRHTREHRYDIDLLRVLCAVAVIVLHTGGELVEAAERDPANGPAVYWIGMVINSATRFAVPVFFAMAGWATFVAAPPKDGARLWSRVRRVVVPLAVWSAVYIVWGRLIGTAEDPARRLAVEAAFGSVRPAYHLWYLYVWVPVVLVLGFLALVRAGKRPWVLGAVLLLAAAGPQLLGDLGRVTGRDMPPFEWSFSVYPMVWAALGCLLLPLGRVRGRGWWAALGVLGAGGILVYQSQVHYVIPNSHPLVGLVTVCVLLAVCRIRVPERHRPLIGRLAGVGLGAYLVHVLILEALGTPLIGPGLSWTAAAGLAAALSAATVALSFGAALLWTRCGLSRWLG